MIDSGEFSQNRQLPTERRLSEALGVGRRTVRQALEVLELDGVIWRRQGKGTFLGAPPDAESVIPAEALDIPTPAKALEARLALEPGLASLCAERATEEDVARLRFLAQRASEVAHPAAILLWDGAFHRVIARTADNVLLQAAFTLVDRAWSESIRSLVDYAPPDGAAPYTDLIDAIAAKDPEAARLAMRAHLEAEAVGL